MSERDLIDALSARIAELEARLGALDDHVKELQARRRGSMREDLRCPACGGGELVHVRQATQVGDAGITRLGLHHTYTWSGGKARGTFEYHACRGCRLVELHATDLDELLDHVADDDDNVTTLSAPIDAPPAGGPYR